MNLVEFELQDSSFDKEDRARVDAFKSIFTQLDAGLIDQDEHALPAIRDRFTDEEMEAIADSLERGVMAGVEAIESIWFIIGEFLYMLSRGGLWKYLDGSPDSLYAWVTLRDGEYKQRYNTDDDNPLMKSYPLLSKYRLIYRKWFYEIGRHDQSIVDEVRKVGNVDVLQAYTQVISPEKPKNAKAWAIDAQHESDKNRAQRKARIAINLAEKKKVQPYDITPRMVNRALKEEEKRYPDAHTARSVPARYRGAIPLDAYVEEEVNAVSESETRITIRVIDD